MTADNSAPHTPDTDQDGSSSSNGSGSRGGSGVKVTHTPTRTTTHTHTHTSTSGFRVNGLFQFLLGIIACLLLASYSFVHDYVVDAGLFLGTVKGLNTQGCVPITLGQQQRQLNSDYQGSQGSQGRILQACEDVHIHRPSGLAFAACGHAESRKIWYPAAGKRGLEVPKKGLLDELVVYNIDNKVAKTMELVGFPADADRVFCGFDIYEDPLDKSKLTILLINQRRTGSVVEVLEYTFGDGSDSNSDAVQYVETIQHELIQTPNDILALGPRSFYVTNDHYYSDGIMRAVEEKLRLGWSNVLYVSPTETFIAYYGIASSNGITSNQDKSLIYVSALHGAALHILRPIAASSTTSTKLKQHELVSVDYVKLDYYVDNLSFDPATNSVFVAGHVQPLKLLAGLDTLDKPVQGPSRIVKVSRNENQKRRMQFSLKGISWDYSAKDRYNVDRVLQNDGKLISTATTAVVDRDRGVLLVGTGFSEMGLWECPIPEGL
ncbi:Serum paraoxonase/arylesterase 2 [Mortierella sp. AD094]|nr:Serum paraoxonase/arylesterase 2 [Mortierella sp. AD094]